MENTALKIAVQEYGQILVAACNLRLQADHATGVVSQLNKTKPKSTELSAARKEYTALLKQWKQAMVAVKAAYTKAVSLKQEFLESDVDIPSYAFLEGKRHENLEGPLAMLKQRFAAIESIKISGAPPVSDGAEAREVRHGGHFRPFDRPFGLSRR
ncbi:hypothetical protein NP233_g10748 [Leucocoprinus birnbaumii]|uniref:Uncharacterized protein n=1 Tax=Leucocoprinus birnbaumii TaxID=56174 RepID=A0AAD5VI51_9AGAR|nr:hypothetical protein NP233_g10748 [Leucocoprinus birnbaumii]